MPLPTGWTLDRVREVAHVDLVELVEPMPTVTLQRSQVGDHEQVEPTVVLHLGGYYLVLEKGDVDDWLMGQADDGGKIVCWAHYGSLDDALRAL